MDQKKEKGSEERVLIRIDCLGDICPIPMMRLQKVEKNLSQGEEVMVVTDHSCAAENIMDYCRARHYSFYTIEPINGVWEIYLRKSPPT